RLVKALSYGFVQLPQDIVRSLLLGLLIAAAIDASVPEDFFSAWLGHGLLSMVVMMAVGVPVYVCATGSVPVAAALMTKGIAPGAALVFLMTGPATNAATITTLWRVLGRRTTLIYLTTVALTSLGAGLLLDLLLDGRSAAMGAVSLHGRHLGPFRLAFAVALSGVLTFALWRSYRSSARPQADTAQDAFRLPVSGMTCSHCAQSVERALSSCEGVDQVEVDLVGGAAYVRGRALDAERLRHAVKSLGFDVS
ncbi:MAG: permease, partial [Acidobacteriota bacterium]